MTTLAVPEPVLIALRDPRLRRHHADRVFAELWDSLSYDEARVAKIRQTARMLHVMRPTMRRALALLVDLHYLQFSHRDSRGRSYYRKTDRRRGHHVTPILPLTADAA